MKATNHVSRLTPLACSIREYFRLGVVSNPAVTNAGLTFTGAIPDNASQIAQLNLLNLNGQCNTGFINFQTSAAATITLTALGNLEQRLTNGGAVTVTIDAAYNIANNLMTPTTASYLGQVFTMAILATGATTVATPTLLDTAVTLSGTTSVLAAAMRAYQGQITQLATTVGSQLTVGTTFTSLAQVGSSNLYTVTLGTNAISPTVGNVIFINVTAGTLPPGWYPIVKVTSATSFIIAAPIASAAWTATAATLPGTTVVPVSQYQAGYTTGVTGAVGIYSPLITITGRWATATAIITV